MRRCCREEGMQRSLRRCRLARSGQPQGLRLAGRDLFEHFSSKLQALESTGLRPYITEYGECLPSVGQDRGAYRAGAWTGPCVELLPALAVGQRPEKLLFGVVRCHDEQDIQSIRCPGAAFDDI